MIYVPFRRSRSRSSTIDDHHDDRQVGSSSTGGVTENNTYE